MRLLLLCASGAAALSPLRCGPPPRDQRAILPGAYAYESVVLLPGDVDSTRFAGRLVVDRVSPDSLGGRLDAAGLDARLEDGRFEVVSYRVVARRTRDSLALVHAVARSGDPHAPRCHVGATRPGFFVEGRCALRLIAP